MEQYTPTIIKGEQRQDDEILAKTPLDATALGGDSSLIIMELLQLFKVRDVMKRQVITILRSATLRQAQVLMRDNRISGVPVCEDGRLFGIVSVNDIIRGLDGGHSGGMIHMEKGNSNKILGRILHNISKEMICNIAMISGGFKSNAIPREADCDIMVPNGKGDRARKLAETCFE